MKLEKVGNRALISWRWFYRTKNSRLCLECKDVCSGTDVPLSSAIIGGPIRYTSAHFTGMTFSAGICRIFTGAAATAL